jgi:hypothetical protein
MTVTLFASVSCQRNPHTFQNSRKFCRQPQQMLSAPSAHATCFGRTNRPQALNARCLKRLIKCMYILDL